MPAVTLSTDPMPAVTLSTTLSRSVSLGPPKTSNSFPLYVRPQNPQPQPQPQPQSQPQPQPQARPRRPRTWRWPWASVATSSTARLRWTTRVWATSSRDWPPPGPGAASMSSTASSAFGPHPVSTSPPHRVLPGRGTVGKFAVAIVQLVLAQHGLACIDLETVRRVTCRSTDPETHRFTV